MSGGKSCGAKFNEFVELLKRYESGLCDTAQTDDWRKKGKREEWLAKVGEMTQVDGITYELIWELEGSREWSASQDEWKQYKRNAVYKMFMGCKEKGVYTKRTLTHCVLFLKAIEDETKNSARSEQWEEEEDSAEKWIDEMNSLIDPIEEALFISDLMEQLREMTRDDSDEEEKEEERMFSSAKEMRESLDKTRAQMREAADKIERHVKNVGIAKTTGGGASVVGGFLAGAGLFAATLATGGGALLVAGTGVAIGAAGGVAAGGAEYVKGKLIAGNEVDMKSISIDCACLCYAAKQFGDSTERLEKFLNTPEGKKLLKILMDEGKVHGKFIYTGVTTTMNVKEMVRVVGMIRMIRPELAAQLGANMSKATIAAGVTIPKALYFPITGKTGGVIIAAGSRMAQGLAAAGAAVGVVFGVLDIVGGVKYIKRSEDAENLRKAERDLDDTMKNIETFWVS